MEMYILKLKADRPNPFLRLLTKHDEAFLEFLRQETNFFRLLSSSTSLQSQRVCSSASRAANGAASSAVSGAAAHWLLIKAFGQASARYLYVMV